MAETRLVNENLVSNRPRQETLLGKFSPASILRTGLSLGFEANRDCIK
jgi:hypothetical protein